MANGALVVDFGKKPSIPHWANTLAVSKMACEHELDLQGAHVYREKYIFLLQLYSDIYKV